MTDEIDRLNTLRRAALDARTLAQRFADQDGRDGAAARAGVLCWRVARIATARLRAHPNGAFHRDPGHIETLRGLLRGMGVGCLARYRKRPLSALQAELHRLSRVLDDVRALTLSPDLSDALGRAQWAMRQLVKDIEYQARIEGGAWQSALHTQGTARLAPSAPGDSPYLAL